MDKKSPNALLTKIVACFCFRFRFRFCFEFDLPFPNRYNEDTEQRCFCCRRVSPTVKRSLPCPSFLSSFLPSFLTFSFSSNNHSGYNGLFSPLSFSSYFKLCLFSSFLSFPVLFFPYFSFNLLTFYSGLFLTRFHYLLSVFFSISFFTNFRLT